MPGELNLRTQTADRMAIKNYLLGEGYREGEERVRVRKGKFVLTNSVLYSPYESVMIPRENTGNPFA